MTNTLRFDGYYFHQTTEAERQDDQDGDQVDADPFSEQQHDRPDQDGE